MNDQWHVCIVLRGQPVEREAGVARHECSVETWKNLNKDQMENQTSTPPIIPVLLPIPTDTLANQETVILIGLFKEVFGSSQLIDGHPEFEASLQPSKKKKLIDSKPGRKPKNDDTMSKIRLIPQMHHVGWILTVDGRNPAPLGIYKTL